jgi:hypothetical protein
MGLDTKTYWLTGRQYQCDFDFDFDFDFELESVVVDQNSGSQQSKELNRAKNT